MQGSDGNAGHTCGNAGYNLIVNSAKCVGKLINRDCYGAGWVVRLRAGNWAEESAELVTGADGLQKYTEYLAQEGISCE